MNELALFAGAGGGILGAKLLGWRTVCAVEIDPYRCERLAQRQNEGFLPPFPIWNGDIAAFDGKPWRGIVDVVSGGFPCQDISAANPFAEGITGPRSGLWKEMLRIIREVGPGHVLVENSPMLAGRGLGVVLGDLAALGFDARWGVLGADDLNGFHRRERIFIVGHSNQERCERQLGKQTRRDAERRSQNEPCETNQVVVVANGSIKRRGAEYEQQECARGRPREQSDGRGEAVADRDRSRELQPEGIKPEQRQRIIDGNADCLWLHREFIECRDGRTRAAKPGVCGMADGVANRMDRIAAVGDGQVPVVVSAAWQILNAL